MLSFFFWDSNEDFEGITIYVANIRNLYYRVKGNLNVAQFIDNI